MYAKHPPPHATMHEKIFIILLILNKYFLTIYKYYKSYVFINSDEVLYNGKEVIRVKYKCTKTNNIFSNYKYVTQDIKYIMYEYKDFVDSLKALDKIYSLILGEFADSCIGQK